MTEPAKRGRPSKLAKLDAEGLLAIEAALLECQAACLALHENNLKFKGLHPEHDAAIEKRVLDSIDECLKSSATWRQIAEMMDVGVSSAYAWWNRRKKMLSNTHNPVLDSDVIGADNPT